MIGFDVPDAAAVRPVRMLVADLITFAAAFSQYDALQVLKSNFDLAKTSVDVGQPEYADL